LSARGLNQEDIEFITGKRIASKKKKNETAWNKETSWSTKKSPKITK
jgi:hypothetical protein